jgi:site-specific recombinase XerD
MKKPWFRNQTGWWYVSIRNGSSYDQVKLVKAPNTKEGKKLAEEELIQELAARGFDKDLDSPVGNCNWITVGHVMRGFLAHSRSKHLPETAETYRYLIMPFLKAFADLRIHRLRKKHITMYLNTKNYNSTSENRFIGAIKRAFNWAVEEEYISRNPIAHVRKPKALTRDRTLTQEERQLILSSIEDEAFNNFVRALSMTGCHPSEVARVTTQDVDIVKGLWILQKHKTAKQTGQPRIVYLCQEAFELTKSLIEKHPTGPLFLNKVGKAWTRNAIRIRFRRLREQHPQLKEVSAYTYRHSFATDALERGIPIPP